MKSYLVPLALNKYYVCPACRGTGNRKKPGTAAHRRAEWAACLRCHEGVVIQEIITEAERARRQNARDKRP